MCFRLFERIQLYIYIHEVGLRRSGRHLFHPNPILSSRKLAEFVPVPGFYPYRVDIERSLFRVYRVAADESSDESYGLLLHLTKSANIMPKVHDSAAMEQRSRCKFQNDSMGYMYPNILYNHGIN